MPALRRARPLLLPLPAPAPDCGYCLGTAAVETGETAWQYQQHAAIYSPLLANAGGLLFTNDVDRFFSAHDLDTGKTIWKTRLGTGGSGTTVTYSVGGRQYIAVVASANGVGNPGEPLQVGTDSATGPGGNMIWVFALPAAK